MDVVDYVSEKLELTREETMNNSKVIDDELTYYWNPIRGGKNLIVNKKGDYLMAGSGVGFGRLLEEYKKGEKNKNFFTEP